MHTTTVRFPRDTWAQLQLECARAGIPAGQYIREATIARLASAGPMIELAALRRDVDQLRAQLAAQRSR